MATEKSSPDRTPAEISVQEESGVDESTGDSIEEERKMPAKRKTNQT
jgi:hypothetical protein